MKELILLKSGEIALKGLNRASFEDMLIKNAKYSLSDLGRFKFYKAQSALYCEPTEEGQDLDEVMVRLSRVFGFAGLSRALIVEKDFDAIRAAAPNYLRETLMAARTFKVQAKRSDKKFPFNSPHICRELGGDLLEHFPHLKVDVENPQVTVTVEVRDFAAYIHTDQQPGAGGIPVGSGGRAALLVSGGIDSPVAGYMMAKRGLKIIGVHFASPPYTSDRALLKVEKLCEITSDYLGRVRLHVVPFTRIQEEIKDKCPEDYFTLVMRRYMMKIATIIAQSEDCGALVTGESLGQVASQTVQALACTDESAGLPVLRPVIGMDKEEIIRIARHIDTFETSILPYEDCCTVFTPRHPRTKPKLADLLAVEQKLDEEALIREAVEGTVLKTLYRK
ncbi:tRNA uracil 4-sulfurtransferase ThiI [Oscillospiraceae bacterium MB08-C2-2]|nr:tRNA uracil 4-sulfurtransferase ThiI [Oscillospiraceae bacterium MB08-C2-2]